MEEAAEDISARDGGREKWVDFGKKEGDVNHREVGLAGLLWE